MHLCTMHSLINRLLHATLEWTTFTITKPRRAYSNGRRDQMCSMQGALRAALGNWTGKRHSHGWRCTGRAREQCVQLLPTFVHAAQPAGVVRWWGGSYQYQRATQLVAGYPATCRPTCAPPRARYSSGTRGVIHPFDQNVGTATSPRRPPLAGCVRVTCCYHQGIDRILVRSEIEKAGHMLLGTPSLDT